MANDLPTEVVTHIMTYLLMSDRNEMALVNKTWYEASQDPILQRGLKYTFHVTSSSSVYLPQLIKRRAIHLTLDNIDTSSFAKKLILQAKAELATNLLSLSFKGSEVSEKTFVELLRHCHSLQSLDVSCCNSLFMTGMLLQKESDMKAVKEALVNVKEVNLSSIRYLSDATFNRILAACPNTESILLAGNQIIFHSDKLYKTIGSNTQGNSAVVTFKNVIGYLKVNGSRVKSLDLSRTCIHDEALLELASIPDLQLRQLSLVCCRDLGFSQQLEHFWAQQSSLEILDLSHCEDLTDMTLAMICMHSPKLHSLNVGHCRRLTDMSIAKIQKLALIQKLNVSSCYVLTSLGLMLGLCKNRRSVLTDLNLSCCSSVKDRFVAEASYQLPNLTRLNLSSCSITDKSIHYISKFLTQLQVLQLSWCKNISDKGLLGIVDEKDPRLLKVEEDELCKCNRRQQVPAILNLPKLAANEENNFDPKFPCSSKLHIAVHKTEKWLPISNLKCLQVLDLSACHRVTDASIMEVVAFPELKELVLGMCPAITNQSLIAIARNVPYLENLNLVQCHNINDEGLEVVLKSLWRLHSLNIASCDGITNVTLDNIRKYGKRLRHLDLSLCKHISQDAVDRLEDQMKQLCSVQRRLSVDGVFDSH